MPPRLGCLSVLLLSLAGAIACGSSSNSRNGASSNSPDGSSSNSPNDASANSLNDASSNSPNDGGNPEGSSPGVPAQPTARACLDSPDAGPPGVLNWAIRLGAGGGTSRTSGNAVAIDPSTGDVAVAGDFQGGSADLGGYITYDAGASDPPAAFIAKYDTTGKYRWAHTFGSSSFISGTTVAIDRSSNVVLGGDFEGPTDFGGGAVMPIGGDIFLAKFSSSGSYLWSKHFGVASGTVTLLRVVVDSSGDIFLVGETDGNPLDLGCEAMPSGTSFFAARLDPAGSCVFSKAYGTTRLFRPHATTSSERLALDPDGNVLLSGSFFGTLDFGGGALVAPASVADIFVAKLTGTGSQVWAKAFDSGTDAQAPGAQATGIASDGSGNVMFTGEFAGTLDVGAGAMTNGSGAILLAKLDSTGSALWSTQFTCDMNARCPPNSIAVDAFGAPAIIGTFSGNLDFGGGVITGPNASDSAMFIAKFSSAGKYSWAYAGASPLSTASEQVGLDVTASGTTVVGVGAFSSGTLSLDGSALTPTSPLELDTYVAAFCH